MLLLIILLLIILSLLIYNLLLHPVDPPMLLLEVVSTKIWKCILTLLSWNALYLWPRYLWWILDFLALATFWSYLSLHGYIYTKLSYELEIHGNGKWRIVENLARFLLGEKKKKVNCKFVDLLYMLTRLINWFHVIEQSLRTMLANCLHMFWETSTK